MDTGIQVQSGIVLAVLLAAVLFADRLGGTEEVVKRLFQVVLALAVAFAVLGATSAAIRTPDSPGGASIFEDIDDDEDQEEFIGDLADRGVARTVINFGLGIAAVIAGVVYLRQYPTIAPAILLGGGILVVFGGAAGSSSVVDPSGGYFAFLSLALAAMGEPSLAVDILRAAIVAAGAVALIIVGVRRWDLPAQESVTTPTESGL